MNKKNVTDIIVVASAFALAGAGALFLRTGLDVATGVILPYVRKLADK